MKIEIKSHIESTNKETVDIHIEFDPMHTQEERCAALITAMVDMVKSYDRLNSLSDS